MCVCVCEEWMGVCVCSLPSSLFLSCFTCLLELDQTRAEQSDSHDEARPLRVTA